MSDPVVLVFDSVGAGIACPEQPYSFNLIALPQQAKRFRNGYYKMTDRVLSTLLTLLSLIAIGLLAHNFYLSRSLSQAVGGISSESPLEYGDRVNQNALQHALDQGGYSDQLNSHKYLLLYFLPASDFQDLKSIKYGEPLLQRYEDSGLQVLAVTNGQQPKYSAWLRMNH